MEDDGEFSGDLDHGTAMTAGSRQLHSPGFER
jgi:hypothetical protein